LANHAKAAHQSLIQAIVEADNDLEGETNPILRRLLLLMVLIKYLEDRRVFPDEWFGEFHNGAGNFFEVLQGGEPEEVYRLLDFLENKFNGDIFALPRTGQHKLTIKNLETFADLVEARTLNRQRYLWEQFSFEHLPVEIISHIYQRFVHGGHGTVYTPPFLAALLLDHAMPYNKITGKERVLDPACGSGVFLVGAFRRLVNTWRSRHKWQKPDVKALQNILHRSIWGVELDTFAVDLTVFSLSLAICDALKPEVIWNELKFDPLRGSNLFESDFFEVLLDAKQNKRTFLSEGFDIVIGNPPFESRLSDPGEKIAQIAQKQDTSRGSLPDKQAAYLFLEQTLAILRPDGKICLLQPSGLLYNRNTQTFRTAIFRKHRIKIVLDFTSIRNLYEADPKTVAVLAYAAPPSEEHWIDHWTFRRTVSVHERICFELDHYDRHRVSQKQAESDVYVWRVNLLGGGRLLGLSQRLRSMRTLKEFVEQRGWDYGEGFIVGSGKYPAPFLINKNSLPTAALSTSGIDEEKIRKLPDISGFDSPRNVDRFTPPLMLIKELDSLPVAYWDKGFLSYRHRIVGIRVPELQALELQTFYEQFLSNHYIYRFYSTLHGTESLVNKATSIRKQDIDALPYPENLSGLSFTFWELALYEDVLNHITEYVRLGQNSQSLKKAADVDDLLKYSGMFTRMLGSVYDNLQAAAPVFLNGLTCQPFYFGERPNLSWIEEQNEDELRKLIYDDNKHAHLRTIRVLRFYSENVLLLVKPDRLRYWIRSTAIRDADETLIDLRQQGY
jgi:SAM-dependent methyltransferase